MGDYYGLVKDETLSDATLASAYTTKANSEKQGKKRLNRAHLAAMPDISQAMTTLRDAFIIGKEKEKRLALIQATEADLQGLDEAKAAALQAKLEAYRTKVQAYFALFEDKLQFLVAIELYIRDTTFTADQNVDPRPESDRCRATFLAKATSLAKKTAQERERYYLFEVQQHVAALEQQLQADADARSLPIKAQITSLLTTNKALQISCAELGIVGDAVPVALGIDNLVQKLANVAAQSYLCAGHRTLTEQVAQSNTDLKATEALRSATGQRLSRQQQNPDYTVFNESRKIVEPFAWEIIAGTLVNSDSDQYGYAFQRQLREDSRRCALSWADPTIVWDEYTTAVKAAQVNAVAVKLIDSVSRRSRAKQETVSAAITTARDAANGDLAAFENQLKLIADTEIKKHIFNGDELLSSAKQAFDDANLILDRFDAAKTTLIELAQIEFDPKNVDLNPYERAQLLLSSVMRAEQKLHEHPTPLATQNKQKREAISALVEKISGVIDQQDCRPTLDVNKADHALLLINSALQTYLRKPRVSNLLRGFSWFPSAKKGGIASQVLQQLEQLKSGGEQNCLQQMQDFLEQKQQELYQYDIENNWFRRVILRRPAHLHDVIKQCKEMIEALLKENPHLADRSEAARRLPAGVELITTNTGDVTGTAVPALATTCASEVPSPVASTTGQTSILAS